jgi:hypothetical protein
MQVFHRGSREGIPRDSQVNNPYPIPNLLFLSSSSSSSYIYTLMILSSPHKALTIVSYMIFSHSHRDPRGFAVKFYTREGNFDMVRIAL